ncbi:MAG TPA: sarcosine oxidase subunit gamma family protein [Candidatus Competibacteraceae bacterium]|nr:sarcosine oxidase subunit gamma family protein [Candidatus Competibacteraceae bacterium]
MSKAVRHERPLEARQTTAPLRRESPLVGRGLAARVSHQVEGKGVLAAERAFLGHLNLRGDPADAAFRKAAEGVLGLALPCEPNTVAEGNGLTVYWLCPSEWLVVTAPDAEAALAAKLRQALAGQFAAVTEISSGQTVLVLRGDKARELLAKGCPLDLHPRVFGPGQCAQTLIAKAPALIRPLADGGYEVVVRRSFADYLWHWLEHVADQNQYGLTVVAA